MICKVGSANAWHLWALIAPPVCGPNRAGCPSGRARFPSLFQRPTECPAPPRRAQISVPHRAVLFFDRIPLSPAAINRLVRSARWLTQKGALLTLSARGRPRPGLSHGGALDQNRRPHSSDALPLDPSTAVFGACHWRSFWPQHACSCSQQVPQQTAASLADPEGSPDASCIRKRP